MLRQTGHVPPLDLGARGVPPGDRRGVQRIEAVRKLLVEADDLGEAAVEESDPATGKQFVALRTLIDRRFDAGSLILELTESAVVETFEEALATLQRLRWMSVQLAMDDFGTGYSSLSSLSRLPLDILKIDQSFVARLDQDAEGRAVVYAIVSLATALGVRVTGEGIETASQLSTLIELDCNHGQGFLLGRPAPPDELAAMLRTVNPTEVTIAARLARLQ